MLMDNFNASDRYPVRRSLWSSSTTYPLLDAWLLSRYRGISLLWSFSRHTFPCLKFSWYLTVLSEGVQSHPQYRLYLDRPPIDFNAVRLIHDYYSVDCSYLEPSVFSIKCCSHFLCTFCMFPFFLQLTSVSDVLLKYSIESRWILSTTPKWWAQSNPQVDYQVTTPTTSQNPWN